MKTQLQIVQEKRGAYTRKRTKMFSHMSSNEIYARRDILMRLAIAKAKSRLPKITGMKVGVEVPKLSWFKRILFMFKRVFFNSSYQQFSKNRT